MTLTFAEVSTYQIDSRTKRAKNRDFEGLESHQCQQCDNLYTKLEK